MDSTAGGEGGQGLEYHGWKDLPCAPLVPLNVPSSPGMEEMGNEDDEEWPSTTESSVVIQRGFPWWALYLPGPYLLEQERWTGDPATKKLLTRLRESVMQLRGRHAQRRGGHP